MSRVRACGFSFATVLTITVVAGCGGGDRVAYDLAEAVERRSLRLEQSRIEFDARDHAEGFFLEGWSGHQVTADGETTFTRIVGERARLRWPVFDTGRRRLVLRGRAPGTGETRRQGLRVRLNRRVIGRVELRPEFHTFTLPLPEGALQDGDNRVTLILASGKQNRRRDTAQRGHADIDFLALGGEVEPRRLSLRVEGDRIVQPARSELRIPVIVPRAASLTFRISTDLSGGEHSTRVLLRRTGEEERVVFTLPPGADPEAEVRLDLGKAAAHDGEIVFQVLARGAARGTVAWERPRLTGEAGDMDVRSNVLLIVVDTLRSDMLSCYGGEVPTPNMDALAASGVLFRRSYAHAPMTMPSHASMFTSLLPSEHGARLNAQSLPFAHLTLAELLQRAYRRSAAFVSLGVLASDFGMSQGFDEYHDDFELNWWKDADEMNELVLPWLERQATGLDGGPFFLWAHYSDPHEPYDPPGTEHGKLQAVLDGEPLKELPMDGSVQALTLALAPGGHEIVFEPEAGEPHSLRIWQVEVAGAEVACGRQCKELPSIAGWSSFAMRLPAGLVLTPSGPEPLDTELRLRTFRPVSKEETRRRYMGEIAFVDREIGRLLDVLRVSGLEERTLVVLTSDHGEGLGDHGLGGHVEQLYDSLLRVPLLLSYPGRLPSGKVVEDPVAHVDLLPTVAELFRIPDPVERRGASLVPAISGSAGASPPHPIFAQTFRPQATRDLRAIVHRGFKMIHTVEDRSPADDEGPELYELASDPGELQDLAGERSGLAKRLKEILDARMSFAEGRGVTAEELDAKDREMLRALGYLR